MPSLVIINLTNIILNVAICQVGPLYYQNKLLPGETMHRSLGELFFAKQIVSMAISLKVTSFTLSR